jgi:hypothetical protein
MKAQLRRADDPKGARILLQTMSRKTPPKIPRSPHENGNTAGICMFRAI